MSARTLSMTLLDKFREQFDRTLHLVESIPPLSLDWSPPYEHAWTNRELIQHLNDVYLGVCAVLAAAMPHLENKFEQLRCTPPPDLQTIWQTIDEAFGALNDDHLSQVVPSVFVADGQTVLMLLLNNLEHIVNHKHQLFLHLRLMNVALSSSDLYCFHSTDSPH